VLFIEMMLELSCGTSSFDEPSSAFFELGSGVGDIMFLPSVVLRASSLLAGLEDFVDSALVMLAWLCPTRMLPEDVELVLALVVADEISHFISSQKRRVLPMVPTSAAPDLVSKVDAGGETKLWFIIAPCGVFFDLSLYESDWLSPDEFNGGEVGP